MIKTRRKFTAMNNHYKAQANGDDQRQTGDTRTDSAETRASDAQTTVTGRECASVLLTEISDLLLGLDGGRIRCAESHYEEQIGLSSRRREGRLDRLLIVGRLRIEMVGQSGGQRRWDQQLVIRRVRVRRVRVGIGLGLVVVGLPCWSIGRADGSDAAAAAAEEEAL